jgi:hypothetical protein
MSPRHRLQGPLMGWAKTRAGSGPEASFSFLFCPYPSAWIVIFYGMYCTNGPRTCP